MIKRKYPKQPIAAVGAIIKNHSHILLIRRKYEPSKGKWSIPGGLVELGETIREAIKREVEEEVDLKIEIEGILDVVDNIKYDERDKVKYHYIITDFIAKSLTKEVKGSAEVIEVRWFKPTDLENLDLTNTTKTLLKKIEKSISASSNITRNQCC